MDSGVGNQSPVDEPSEVSSVYNVTAADVEEAPHALAGRRIGRYKLLLPVAVGGMAQVWTARPESAGLARTVAIKLVRPEYAADDEYSRMFVDEAMVASSIHHPNVCETYDLGRDGDLLFMVLEWVAGDSLNGVLQCSNEIQALPDAIAARIVAEACAGLHAAHEALGPDGHPLGIVHRDVSPPNILVSMHGHVKVSDFGIAKARNQLHSRTRTGQIKGKFAYIPPEQILGRGVDRRADLYAMGCVLYLATLGVRPFGSGPAALPKIVQGKYALPSELRADYPAGLEAVIVKALSADPKGRFQTADEMRLAIEQWMMESGSLAVASDVAAIVQQRLKPERRKLLEAVTSSSRKMPANLAYELLANQDRTATPTAATGVVLQPAIMAKEHLDDGEATLIAEIKPGSGRQPPAAPEAPTLRPGAKGRQASPFQAGSAPATGADGAHFAGVEVVPPPGRRAVRAAWVAVIAVALVVAALAYQL